MSWRLPKPIWEAINEFRAIACTDTPVPAHHFGSCIDHDGHRALLSQSLDRNNSIASLRTERLGADRPGAGLFQTESNNDQRFTLVHARDRTLQPDWDLRTHVQ